MVKLFTVRVTLSSMATLIVAIVLGAICASAASTLPQMTEAMDQYFENLSKENKAITVAKLQVYIHAYFAIGTENQTVFQVASSEITAESPTTFGRVLAIDNPLTAGVEPESRYLGRYQGYNAYSDFREPSATMSMNIIFSEDNYEGSTITILGRQPVNHEVRALSVIGGNGVFRFAKGIVLASTVSIDPDTSIGTYVYVMYVVTPPSPSSVGRLSFTA